MLNRLIPNLLARDCRVMPGLERLEPGIQTPASKVWMAGSSPAMTRRLHGLLAFGFGIGAAIIVLVIVAGTGLIWTNGAFAAASPAANGVVKVKSNYGFDETITRLKEDIAKKGIMFFSAIDQASLAENAGIKLRPSTLLIFGNPPLGIQFLTSKPEAGLDWPVRLLVTEDAKGQVWAVYSDFGWVARRHHIKDRDAAFKMASEVIASITSSVASK